MKNTKQNENGRENNLKSRIARARQSNNEHMNCHGTALYLVGKQEIDQSVDGDDAKKIFAKMRRTKRFDIGNLVTWEVTMKPNYPKEPYSHLTHTAVVTHVNPVLVTHRDGYNGPLIEDVELEEVKLRYGLRHEGRIYDSNSSPRCYDFLISLFKRGEK